MKVGIISMSDLPVAKRFAASAIGVLLARVMALVAVFGLNVALARALSPADFGFFILFFSLAGLAALIACVGLNRSIVVRIAKDHQISREAAQGVIRFGLLIAVLGGCVTGIVAGAGSYLLLAESATVSALMRGTLFGSIILVRTVHLVLAETARGFHERIWSNLFGGPAGGPIPHLLFVGLLLLLYPYVQGSLAVALGLYLVAFVVTLPILWNRVFALPKEQPAQTPTSAGSRAEHNLADGLLVLGVPLMLTQACGLAMSQADIWIAGAMAAPAAIATYAAAQRMLALLTIPLQISGTAIVNFIPELAAKSKPKLQRMVGLAATAGGLPGVALAVIFMVFAEQILTIVFGSHYAEAGHILRILAAGQVICLLTGPCEIVLSMAGQQKATLRVNVCAAIALVILGPLAIVGYGMLGLAAAIAVVTATQNLVNWYLAHRLLGISTHVGALPWKLPVLSRTAYQPEAWMKT
jgi:O-antigen/teichoic acid export membrane protein